jgi:hypothetical protein
MAKKTALRDGLDHGRNDPVKLKLKLAAAIMQPISE